MTVLLRKPRRISITVSDHVYQLLITVSDQQGRSLSNYAAYLLEASIERSSTATSGLRVSADAAGLIHRSGALQPKPVFRQ